MTYLLIKEKYWYLAKKVKIKGLWRSKTIRYLGTETEMLHVLETIMRKQKK